MFDSDAAVLRTTTSNSIGHLVWPQRAARKPLSRPATRGIERTDTGLFRCRARFNDPYSASEDRSFIA